jgi:Domain of unknown function (DUF6916)
MVVAGLGAGPMSWPATSTLGWSWLSAATPGGCGTMAVMVDELTREAFEPHVGTRFLVSRSPAETVALELVEVRDLVGPPAETDRSFAMLFRGPSGAPLGQGTYEVQHDSVGAFPLFIVLLGVNEGGAQYEAVFNRLPQR